VSLERAVWDGIEGDVQELERHPTYIAGDLVIARVDGSLVAVEEPSSRERVVRLIEEHEVRAFVEDRLDTYERMWDGCGCKVSYYK